MKKPSRHRPRTISKTSRKAIAAKRNPRNNVNFLLNPIERAAVMRHKDHLRAAQGGIPLRLGTYAKHAVLEYPRLLALAAEHARLVERIARPLISNTQLARPSDSADQTAQEIEDADTELAQMKRDADASDGEPAFGGSDDHDELGAGDA